MISKILEVLVRGMILPPESSDYEMMPVGSKYSQFLMDASLQD